MNLKSKFFEVCSITGRIKGVKKLTGMSRIFMPLIGLAAIGWIILRVVPKPARAAYPCVKVAAPVASAFLVYLTGLFASALAFQNAKKHFRKASYIGAAVFVLIGLVASMFVLMAEPKPPAYANAQLEAPNTPMGEAQGINPGRVVWVWNPDATNEDCRLTTSDGWFDDDNNNIGAVQAMLSSGIRSLTGEETEKAAWDVVFKHFNNKHGKGDVTYQSGETIFIKTNATSAWSGNFSESDLSKRKNNNYNIAETNPYVVLAVLRHLVNVVGVPQDKIFVGEPMKHIYKHCFELWYPEFPDVNYVDHTKGSSLKRYKVSYTKDAAIQYSDRGEVMMTGTWNDPNAGSPTESDKLTQELVDADYLINIPTLKGHKRAGITMFAKNHFGTHSRDNAVHLHGGLVNPTEQDPFRQGYGMYRVLVDLMGHERLGGNQLIFIMDALYSGSEATDPPRKFQMAPFNDDWTSSLFLSQDHVAIESVGFDFLRTEFTEDTNYPYPQMEGVDDYLHQAADKANWPDGIQYDPENDGTVIGSLGVHEHWNNSTDMQYTRNLGTGDGIELVKIFKTGSAVEDESATPTAFALYDNYPNPFNPSTTIQYELATAADVELNVFNVRGERIQSLVSAYQPAGLYNVTWNGTTESGILASSGVYFYEIKIQGQNLFYNDMKQMVLMK